MLENEKSKNWSHFATRYRYIKDSGGDYIKDSAGNTKKYIERCWCGKLVKSADWLSDKGAGDSIVYVLCVGNSYNIENEQLLLNVLLVYNKEKNTIYKNKNNSVDNDLYVDFLQKESGAVVVESDNLPTVEQHRKSGVKITDLESALSQAVDLI